jgi:hypothetical protein
LHESSSMLLLYIDGYINIWRLLFILKNSVTVIICNNENRMDLRWFVWHLKFSKNQTSTIQTCNILRWSWSCTLREALFNPQNPLYRKPFFIRHMFIKHFFLALCFRFTFCRFNRAFSVHSV